MLGRHPPLAYRDRRPSWYVSFEMTCILCTAAFVSGTFTGILLAYIERHFP